MNLSTPTSPASSHRGVAGFLLIALALVAGGLGFYRHKAKQVRKEQYEIIRAIGDLKSGQIQSWRKERLSDVRRIARGPLFRQRTEEFVRNPEAAESRADLLVQLDLNRMTGVYSAVLLLSLDGKVLLSNEVKADPVDPATFSVVRAVGATHIATFSDFFRSSKGINQIDVAAPVLGRDGTPVAVVLLRAETDSHLLPMIRTWPIPNVTAWSSLVIRSGEEATTLHPRMAGETSPRWRLHLSQTDTPTVQVVLGKRGFFEGKDYRGQMVFSDLRAIPDSPWFLVSKVDKEEVLAPLRLDALFIGAITGAFILLTGAALAYLFRQRQAESFKALYESERQKRRVEQSLNLSEQWLKLALSAAHQGLYDLDIPTGECTVSDEYVQMLGYEPGTYRESHQAWLEHMHPEDRDQAEAAYQGYLEGQRPDYRVEFRVPTRGGDWKWILSLGTIVSRGADGKPLRMLGTRTDITDLKQSEEAVRTSEKLLLQTQSIGGLGSYMFDLGEGRWTSTKVLDAIFGIDESYDRTTENWVALIHPDSQEQLSRYLAEEVIGKQQSFDREYRIVRAKDGAVRWVHGQGELEFNTQGAPAKLLGTILDITERKQIEVSLREARNQVTQLLQTTDQGIYGLDLEGRCTFVNAAGLKTLGYGLEDCVGRNMHNLIHHSHADGSPYPVGDYPIFRAKSIGIGSRVDHEVLWRKDGTSFPAEYSSYPILEEGQIRGAVVTFSDISERKQVQDALREAEQRFRDLVDSTDGIIWEADAFTFIFHSVSANATRLLGYPVAEFLEPGFWASHLHPEDRVQAIQQRVACTGRWEDHDFEYRFLAKDGRVVWVRDLVKVVVENEQHRWLRGLMVDITAQKQVEAALRASEQEFRDLLWNLPAGVVIYGPDKALLDCNPMARALMNLEPERIKSLMSGDFSWSPRIREDGTSLALADYPVNRVAAGETVQGAVMGFLVEGRTDPLWGLVSAFPLRDALGKLLRIVVTFVDISGLKEAERHQRLLERQLQHSQKMESLGLLAGGVAHDMNNVLGAILGLATAHLELQTKTSSAYRAFDTIAKACQRGAQLVKGLLGISRKGLAEESELDLNTLVREEISLLERTTLSKVRLEMDLAPNLPTICGDAGALSHVLMNLCVNAVDAVPENGVLTLRTRAVGEQVELEVEDNGCGMAADVLDRAMEPFFTTKPQGKGTGLGLSIVFNTVKAHGGTTEINSQPARGTRVTLRFPVSDAVSEASGSEPDILAEPTTPPRSLPMHVLLVDDDELVSNSVQELIELLGYTTSIAFSGEEALAKLEGGLMPDAVILDLNMPGLGGAGTLPLLRALRPNLPVLLATGRVEQLALDLVQAHSGVTLMSKPFTMGELRSHLSEAMRKEAG